MKRMPLALAVCFIACSASAQEKRDALKAAVAKGIVRMQQGAANYPKHRQCFSCHHQALPVFVLTSARQRGFDVKPEQINDIVDYTIRHKKGLYTARGPNTVVGYALATLAEAAYPPDESTAEMVQVLLRGQDKDGAWPDILNRPPGQGSHFTSAALALHGLKKYGAKELPEDKPLRGRIDAAVEKGLHWLQANQGKTTEDKVFRLRGLVHAGGAAKTVLKARDLLLHEQRADGSWAQLPDLQGDAYATGSVMSALRVAGLSPKHPAYEKGVKYLLATQNEDGAWIVQTRSPPIQKFFDNGDPGGKSQFISFAATAWSTLALLETYPVITGPKK